LTASKSEVDRGVVAGVVDRRWRFGEGVSGSSRGAGLDDAAARCMNYRFMNIACFECVVRVEYTFMVKSREDIVFDGFPGVVGIVQFVGEIKH
jgi:hypothetical protein